MFPEAVQEYFLREYENPQEAFAKGERAYRATAFLHANKEALMDEMTPASTLSKATFSVDAAKLQALYRWYVLIAWETLPQINDPSVEFVLKTAREAYQKQKPI